MPIIADVQDKLQMALDVIVGYEPDKDPGISESVRRSYLRIEEVPSPRVIEELFREATTVDYPQALGVSMNRAMITAAPKTSQKWRNFVTVGSLEDFKQQERIVLGEFAGVPKRAEGASYANLGTPPEFASNFFPDTRGGMMHLTRRMMRNDRIGFLQELVRRASAAAWHEFERWLYNIIIGNAGGGGVNTDTVHDSLTLYHANHGNLVSSAPISANSIIACRKRIYDQWHPGPETTIDDTGGISDSDTTIGLASVEGVFPGAIIRIDNELVKVGTVNIDLIQLTGCTRAMYGTTAAVHSDGAAVQVQARPVRPKNFTMVVPRGKEDSAVSSLASGSVPGGTSADVERDPEDGQINLISLHANFMADNEDDWYMLADAESVPNFVVDFLDGQHPNFYWQNRPTSDDDAVIFKLRHEYGGVAVDWRGAQKNVGT